MKLNWKIGSATLLVAVVATVGINHFRLNAHAVEAMKFREVEVLAY